MLRWFETLPHVAGGEDLDLLVADQSLPAVRGVPRQRARLAGRRPLLRVRAPGADYRKLPYYPPVFGGTTAQPRQVHRGLFRVPCPQDHFLSLAYHAVYHKGLASGLAANRDSKPVTTNAEHDYARILQHLTDRLGIDVAITLADLDEYLDSQGWRPPHDMLVRLARKNKWLRTLVKRAADGETESGLAVFLLRREALHRGGVTRAEKLIADHGFQIVETILLEPSRIETVARSLRGGNWGAGPWPVSGGPPVAAIVVHDPAPIRPTRRQQRKFPLLTNARLLKKEEIRDAFNANRPPNEHCNVIHSSDNDREARDYLRIVSPATCEAIFARIPDLPQSLPAAA